MRACGVRQIKVAPPARRGAVALRANLESPNPAGRLAAMRSMAGPGRCPPPHALGSSSPGLTRGSIGRRGRGRGARGAGHRRD